MQNSHFPLNMKKHQISQEVPTPSQVEKMEEPKMLLLIYKAIFYCLSVLLDIRWNTTQNKFKSFKKPENPVLKDSDLHKIKETKNVKR